MVDVSKGDGNHLCYRWRWVAKGYKVHGWRVRTANNMSLAIAVTDILPDFNVKRMTRRRRHVDVNRAHLRASRCPTRSTQGGSSEEVHVWMPRRGSQLGAGYCAGHEEHWSLHEGHPRVVRGDDIGCLGALLSLRCAHGSLSNALELWCVLSLLNPHAFCGELCLGSRGTSAGKAAGTHSRSPESVGNTMDGAEAGRQVLLWREVIVSAVRRNGVVRC